MPEIINLLGLAKLIGIKGEMAGRGGPLKICLLSYPTPLRGQKTMSVYIIIDIAVSDQVLYEEYVSRVPAVVNNTVGATWCGAARWWAWPATGSPNGSWSWNSNPAIRPRNI